ncbi:retrovirus-related Pol polyprotein from transposon 297 [Trichonephila clavipes]|nr:retrovirus-related Pol polyprotein from transposon 297 [Trichonephila clavipes]
MDLKGMIEDLMIEDSSLGIEVKVKSIDTGDNPPVVSRSYRYDRVKESLIISKNGITTEEAQVKTIVEMRPPKNSREVSTFLGMFQCYSKYIKNYGDLCEPLYNLKNKLKKFFWSIEAQKSFDVVETEITEAPVIKLPDFKKPFELFTDASSKGIDAVLNQEQRLVVYTSRKLSSADGNYTVPGRESLAVAWAMNKFRTYSGSLPV